MKIKTKGNHLILMVVLLILAAGAAWAGISGGKLNSSREDVDLSIINSYPEGDPKKPITLGSDTVNLVMDLTLGHSASFIGYAGEPTDPATGDNARAAIEVELGKTLNIKPDSGKKVSGVDGSSLRLFGTGTTNLYEGKSNKYGHTFIQSGTLNIESKTALGGSKLTIGGGSTIGLTEDSTNNLDLSGVSISLRRYDEANTVNTSEIVSFNTGNRDANYIILPELREVAPTVGNTQTIKLTKQGKGRLVLSGETNHSGGTVVEAGILEIQAAPQSAQMIEVKDTATLKSTVSSLLNITFKPHTGTTLSIPASAGEALTDTTDIGDAALSLSGMDTTSLANGSFKIDADLSAVTIPAGEADTYYVRLVSFSAPHGLSASNLSIEAIPPTGRFYAVTPSTDGKNIYAVLSKDVAPVNHISLGIARDVDSATITARLSDGADGKSISFALKDADGNVLSSRTATSQVGGKAQEKFSDLPLATYAITVTSPGYSGITRNFTIDETVGTEDTIDVTIYDLYDEDGNKKLIAVRLDSSPNAFPADASFRYRFIEAGGVATGNEPNAVTDKTTFKAANTTFSNNRTKARFDIDPANLVDENGNRYVLAEGVIYRLWVEDVNSSGKSDGMSDVLLDRDGQYIPDGSLQIATYAKGQGSDTISAWAIATKDGTPQSGVEITFTLLDSFGNPVNISGVPNMPTQQTGPNGRADVTFNPLPDGEYMIRTSVTGLSSRGYSSGVKLSSTSTGSSSGGCNAGLGLLALLLPLAVVKMKKR